MEYGKFLSAAIVGTAAEQSGRLSYESYFCYDPDNFLRADDLLAEDFPMTCEDDFAELTKPRPFHILEDLCRTSIVEVVRIMKLMEKAWKDHLVMKDLTTTEKMLMRELWDYGEEYVTWQCEIVDVDKSDLVNQGKALFTI